MHLNQEYLHDRRLLHRTGYYIDKHQLRHENEPEAIVALAVMAALLTVLLAIGLPSCANAEVSDEQGVRCIIGEAANQGFDGLIAIADALQNRGTTKGVYGCTSARASKEPSYVWERARRAWQEAKTSNPTHLATHWEAVGLYGEPYWASSMTKTVKIKDHTFYKGRD